ncbi:MULTISPECIES: beta-ketoacyl-[acyl-carrier-protein] synthase family protein [Mesorhizobium]|uniref:Nodulation protein E n=1 Tax=Mesorhizobium denitrificans TaxID=2294114 RepID=A0A371XJ09_9HYPH|nr:MULTISPECIES: beta-ketoacyl-[acyl-carrier-protein] synthase family protein [Mesorhizobium]RFC69212.1 beta-ketoacyl-[acyl-carrier-protein] synthase family protein [Mesorhizobium denitrificans]
MSRQRIVITGLGGLCALGTNVADIWDALRAGRSAIGTLSTPLLRDAKTRIGAEIKQLPEWNVDKRRLVAIDRFALLAAMAADEAIRNAAIDVQAIDSSRIGAVVGTGIFGAEAADENYFGLLKEGKTRANVFCVPRIMPSAPAGQVSMIHGLRGPVFGVTSACASSNHAFAAAADQIRLGRADIMLAGGTDAPLVFGVVKGWEALRALARETCRPFSNDRDGLVLGEGSAIAVLESYEHAKARGATILAEFAGAGMSADASDIVSPTVEGPAAAMRACLADARLCTGDVDYINAHGTGTKANDQIETAAIRAVFGSDADKVSVSSTKSMHAHCMGASGALEAIACIMAIREGVVPPTANYREPDPDCDLDVTPNVAKQRPVKAAISNAFAFGGTNAVVAFKSA